MEQRRKQYIDDVHLQLNRTAKAQERDEKTLKNLSKINLPGAVYIEKKDQIKDSIDHRFQEIEKLKQREIDISAGLLDDEINTEYSEQQKIQKTKNDIAKRRKQDEIRKDEDKRNKLYSKPREIDDRQINKDYVYFYKVFNRIGETLPEYMARNLKDMPNNKGYIWRNSWFMGEKDPEQGQPTIMFEKIKKNILLIHEYDEYEYRLYEKIGKERKNMISCVTRTLKTLKN